jgi:cytosine deaminase
MSVNDEGARIAFEEAKAGLAEGGIPVGSAIISPDGKVLGRGRNMRSVPFTLSLFSENSMLTQLLARVQNGSPILHVCSTEFDDRGAYGN